MSETLASVLRRPGRAVFFGGAGVSTESGIPDYRSPEGVYRTKSAFGKSPEEMLTHSFFMAHTDIFYSYYKNGLVHRKAKPNDAHRALAWLEERGKLSAVITQNVDGLHQKAGSKTVHELHGSVERYHCMGCEQPYDLAYVMDPDNCRETVPLCGRCGGVVRPDVVLFEEPLDQKVQEAGRRAVEEADLLIVGGTSLAVYPAALLIQYFGGDRFVLINREETAYDHMADLVIHDSIGQVLSQAVRALYPDFR